MKRAASFVAFLALVLPAAASAHATFVRAEPDNGAVLADPPASVRITFDDAIRVASGNAVVANASRHSVLRGAPRTEGHDLVLEVRRDLPDGDYSVRWSIVSQDGHRERGVLAFGVGAGREAPQSVLGASSPLAWNTVVLRTLYLLGILVGAGAALFALSAPPALRRRLTRPLAHVLFFALLAVFLGGSGIIHDAPSGTRFGLVVRIAVTVALAGGAAAALAPTYRRLLPVAGLAGVALLLAPTLSGHALDVSQPRLLSVPVDIAHTASAALWFGGLVCLVFALPRSSPELSERDALVRRFSTAAFAAVAVLALTGLGRALTEVGGISEVWTTSYGRALIVKTAIFAPLLVLGWLNRTRLLGAFARLRRSALVEVALLVVLVGVVGVLTELPPGDEARATPSSPLAAAQRPPLPPADAVVDARGAGTDAVAIARRPGEVTVTVIGQLGTGANARRVVVDGVRAASCGSGCYRAPANGGPLRVAIGARTLTFTIPERAPDATAKLMRLTRAMKNAKTVVFDETLASSPTRKGTTSFRLVAPNKLTYTSDTGARAIVIGDRRWDSERRGAPFVESPQSPLDVTAPYWEKVRNVHEVEPGVITFLDPRVPAWFRVNTNGNLPRDVRMTAAGHFMVDRYKGFDVPVTVSPPPSR